MQRLLPDHGSAVSYSPEARQVPPAPRPLGEPYPLLVGLYRVYRLVLKDPRHFGRTEHAVVRVEVVVVVLGTVRFARVVARQLPVHTVVSISSLHVVTSGVLPRVVVGLRRGEGDVKIVTLLLDIVIVRGEVNTPICVVLRQSRVYIHRVGGQLVLLAPHRTVFVDHNREAVRGLFGRRGSGPGDGALDGTAGWVQVAVLGQVVEGASVGGARILVSTTMVDWFRREMRLLLLSWRLDQV